MQYDLNLSWLSAGRRYGTAAVWTTEWTCVFGSTAATGVVGTAQWGVAPGTGAAVADGSG